MNTHRIDKRDNAAFMHPIERLAKTDVVWSKRESIASYAWTFIKGVAVGVALVTIVYVVHRYTR